MAKLNYWQQRINRRRALRIGAAGSAAFAGAFAFACGGGDEKKTSAPEAFSIITPPKDTSKEAKRGGILQLAVPGDETTLDALATSRGAGYGGPGAPAYSRLLKEKEFVGKAKSAEFVGDAAESWELSPDGRHMTVKLRPDVKFDPRPPTNGRVLDADDVVFSWNKMVAQSQYAGQLANSRVPASPVETILKIDNRTVQLKLAFPWVPLIPILALGTFLLQPKEAADERFNIRIEPRGSGAWMLDKWETSVGFQWRRNPNWYRKDVPFLDGYNEYIVPEYAAQLSQLRAKNIHSLVPSAADVIDLVKATPELKLYQGDVDSAFTTIVFGGRPDNPFYDVRLRRAMSMAIDRALLADVDSGADLFRKAGIPYPIDFDGVLPSAYRDSEYWLDPTEAKQWGDAGQYWKHDVAEAKKLVDAAGKSGVNVVANLSSRAHGSPRQAEIIAQMVAEAGIKLNTTVVDYNTIFLPKMWIPGPTGKGDFDGLIYGSSGNLRPHVTDTLFFFWHTQGDAAIPRKWDGQAAIDEKIIRTYREFDTNKFNSLVREIQTDHGRAMSGIPYTYGQKAFSVVWPWVQNYNAFGTTGGLQPAAASTQANLNLWIDDTKKI